MNKQLQHSLIWRGFKVLIMAVLIGAVITLGTMIQNSRVKIINKQLALEQSLIGEVHQSTQKIKLNERLPDLNRIRAVVPTQNDLSDFISRLEAEAAKLNINISIPEVTEEKMYDASGQEITPTSVLRAVHLKLEGRGDPANLVRYLHQIEHLPFLLKVTALSLHVGKNEVYTPIGFSAQVPPSDMPPNNQPPVASSTLTVDIVLTISVESPHED